MLHKNVKSRLEIFPHCSRPPERGVEKKMSPLKNDRENIGLGQRYREITHDPLLFGVAQIIF
jgi:hypothetical protein